MLRGWLDLIEARIADARARGLFATTKKGPIEDDLAGLPVEARVEARIAASVGGAPPEVERMRDVVRLREALAREGDPTLRAALMRQLRDAEIERNVLLERTGRAILLHAPRAEDAPLDAPEE